MILLLFLGCFVAILLFNGSDACKNEKSKSLNSENQSNETRYNPATGLPMIGALDSMGNSIGSSASNRNNDWHNDYSRRSSSYSSSYDPFNNRY
ncbi:TPA: hypothetical protein KKX58_001668 [Legionella pneumophila]|nr:hypothetical protein [Legionella pneumophila]HBD7410347.1 hypothetical protein [Legionella pneumophila]HBD9405540.1 hypothetical protein [Legionella pneumophila]HBI2968769.1 hypothetical protein [Legionella pneumophila]